MRHQDITGAAAVHHFCFVQSTDPAGDPDNDVGAGKGWFDTSENRLKIRNAANTAWTYIGDPSEVP